MNSTLSDLRKAGAITKEFIDLLDEAFPDQMPDGTETPNEIQQKIGTIKVIRTIKTWKDMLDNPEAYTFNIFDEDETVPEEN